MLRSHDRRSGLTRCAWALIPGALVALAAGGCRDLAPPERPGTMRPPNFTVVPLWRDTVGICIGAGSPSGSYTFSWIIQNGQPGDIHDVTSPVTASLGPGQCLAPWRRETPLPANVFVTVIVTEVATPLGVALDSVEVQDRFGDHVYLSATDTVQVDTDFGGALTYYHHQLGQFLKLPVLVAVLPLPNPNPSRAFGRMRLAFDPFAPPDPCGPIPPASGGGAVGICGTIHNPGAETFTNGVLIAHGVSIPFGVGGFPPDPCRQYVVQGTFAAPAGLVTRLASAPSSFTLRFDSREHPDGAIGGSPTGGGGTGPEGGVAAAAGASRSERGACLVRLGL